MQSRKSAVVALIALMLAACGTGAPGAATSSPVSETTTPTSGTVVSEAPAQPDQVLLALDWIIGGQHSPYFVALDKGYYLDENIAITIVRGFGSGDTVRRIATKGATFGFADSGPLISARAAEDIPVKAVAAIYNNPPHSIVYNSDRGISEPKDLEGKRIADSPFSAIRQMWPVFAKANGIDATKVEWPSVDPAAVNPSLLSGSADGIGQFTISSVGVEQQAEELGLNIGTFLFADYGVSFYGNSLLSHTDTITQNPDLVRRFVAASIRGYEYALANQEEAITIFEKYFRDAATDVYLEEMRRTQELVLTEDAKRDGIGFIDSQKWSDTVRDVSDALELGAVDAEDLYTTEFLP